MPAFGARVMAINARTSIVRLAAIVAALGLGAAAAKADTLTWGSMTTNTGPTVYDWMIQDWIDEFFEDGSKADGTVSSNIVAYFTQCYGGDALENLNGTTGDTAGGAAFDTVQFTNATSYAANSAGMKSYYNGYHSGAANNLAPGANSDTVHNAGVANKDPRETPQSQGSGKTLGGMTSTHVLIWAGQPETGDYQDMLSIQNAFDGHANTTVTTLAGNGASPFGNVEVDNAATQGNLKSALQTIGALMDDGTDEQFILFVTDHGNLETINTSIPEVLTDTSQDFTIDLPTSLLDDMLFDDSNTPWIILGIDPTQPIQEELVELSLVSASPIITVLLDDPIVEVGTLELPDGSTLNTYALPLLDTNFDLDSGVLSQQQFQLTNLGVNPLQFEHALLSSGDIQKLIPLPAAAWMALPLLGVMGVISKMRRRRCA